MFISLTQITSIGLYMFSFFPPFRFGWDLFHTGKPQSSDTSRDIEVF